LADFFVWRCLQKGTIGKTPSALSKAKKKEAKTAASTLETILNSRALLTAFAVSDIDGTADPSKSALLMQLALTSMTSTTLAGFQRSLQAVLPTAAPPLPPHLASDPAAAALSLAVPPPPVGLLHAPPGPPLGLLCAPAAPPSAGNDLVRAQV
jgi:hypothetical protein